jgi:aspartyl-tRNA(Asn)/glutamyl-tRNA(Gln) amidotransferase subunit A
MRASLLLRAVSGGQSPGHGRAGRARAFSAGSHPVALRHALRPPPAVKDTTRGQSPGRGPSGRVSEALAAARERGRELNAFITVREEAAGDDGVPFGVKDLFDTAGLRTTYGSAIFRDHVPTETAEAVARLEAAGHVVVGKTNLHEFAYGITSENPHFGDVRNPLDPTRTPGGSSGGSAAALAAGLCDLALGSDSGGSIRIPAACCGVVGFKPTFGLVSTAGVFPLAPSFDHAGPMARTVTACAQAMETLADLPTVPPASLDAVSTGVAWLELADPLVRERVQQAAGFFPDRRPVDVPFPSAASAVFRREVADVHRDLFAEHPDAYGANVRTKVEQCLRVTDAEYENALRERETYRERCLAAVEGVDVLVVPTLAFVAPPVGIPELDLRVDMIRFTFPFNVLGWPALALPCGPAEDGLPASVQLVGRPGSDALVLAAGLALEAALVP